MAEAQTRVLIAPGGLPAPARAVRDFFGQHYLTIVITALLLWIVGAPILFLLELGFRTGNPGNPGALTLANYQAAYSSPHTYPALMNTILYAGAASLLSLTLATVFAWLIERTDMPCRNFAWTVMLLPIAMPGMLSSMAWILLLSQRIGIVNVALRGLLGLAGIHLTEGPFNIYTLEGMIFVEAMRGSTTLFLMMVGAFRLMDPALEEAALSAGANSFQAFRRVTMGLMLPALLAAGMYSFLGNLEDFEVPLLLGLAAGVFVLPTLIYFTAYVSPTPNWGLASAYTSIFLIATIILVVIYYRVIIRKSERYATITGKGFRPRRISLGGWRFAALGLFGTYFMLAIGLPFLILVWASLLPIYKVPSLELLGQVSLANYGRILEEPTIVRSTMNSVFLALVTATATMVLAFLVSWLVVRQRVRGGMFLDSIAFIPHAIPAVAVGLALIIFYQSPYLRWMAIYGSLTIMALALMTRYVAFGSRTSNAAMTQINKELEEAAWLSGAGRIRTLIRITTPLLLPAFVAGWLWVAAHAFRNLTIPLLLATPGNQTIAVILFHFWERKADFSLAAAMGVSLMLGLGVVIFLSRKIVTSGFTSE